MSDYNMTKSDNDYNFNRTNGTSGTTTTLIPNESSTITITDYNGNHIYSEFAHIDPWTLQGSTSQIYMSQKVPIYSNEVFINKLEINTKLDVLLYKKKILDTEYYEYDLSFSIDDATLYHNEDESLSWYIKNFNESQGLFYGYMFYGSSVIAEIYNSSLSDTDNHKMLYQTFVNTQNPKLLKSLESLCKK